jgi:hypothetical protein
MKFHTVDPPRKFRPGGASGPEISHVATIELKVDEQITIKTEGGAEVDVVRKEWGFYPLPSLNGRLASFKLYPVLVFNRQSKLYLLLAEEGKRRQFDDYFKAEGMTVLAWFGEKTPD